jgi:hypothetical protein
VVKANPPTLLRAKGVEKEEEKEEEEEEEEEEVPVEFFKSKTFYCILNWKFGTRYSPPVIPESAANLCLRYVIV